MKSTKSEHQTSKRSDFKNKSQKCEKPQREPHNFELFDGCLKNCPQCHVESFLLPSQLLPSPATQISMPEQSALSALSLNFILIVLSSPPPLPLFVLSNCLFFFRKPFPLHPHPLPLQFPVPVNSIGSTKPGFTPSSKLLRIFSVAWIPLKTKFGK